MFVFRLATDGTQFILIKRKDPELGKSNAKRMAIWFLSVKNKLNDISIVIVHLLCLIKQGMHVGPVNPHFFKLTNLKTF